jgi:hypothetical protein
MAVPAAGELLIGLSTKMPQTTNPVQLFPLPATLSRQATMPMMHRQAQVALIAFLCTQLSRKT